MTLSWLISLRLSWKYREIEIFADQNTIANGLLREELVITSRNLLMPGFSGVNFWVENLSRALSRNFNVTIFCQGRLLFKAQRFRANSVSIVALPILPSLKFLKLPLYSAWNATIKKELLENSKYTTVIAPLSGVESYGLSSIYGINIFTLLVTDERTHRFPNLTSLELQELEKFDLRTLEVVSRESTVLGANNSRFLADSSEVIVHLQELFSIDLGGTSVVLPINIAPDTCKPQEKENIFFFIGRCDLRKDLRTLLNAWELIRPMLPTWKLVIATSGGDDYQTFNRVSQMSKQSWSLELIINANESQKHDFLKRSKIVIYPSRYESFGIVALEAMQHGCATIASNVGGIPEVLGSAGVLFEAGSEVDLASSMVWLARNVAHLELLKERSLLRSKSNFSDESVLEIFLNQKSSH
jgi:glycosyltransferase involved in cell wall biosynthesis